MTTENMVCDEREWSFNIRERDNRVRIVIIEHVVSQQFYVGAQDRVELNEDQYTWKPRGRGARRVDARNFEEAKRAADKLYAAEATKKYFGAKSDEK